MPLESGSGHTFMPCRLLICNRGADLLDFSGGRSERSKRYDHRGAYLFDLFSGGRPKRYGGGGADLLNYSRDAAVCCLLSLHACRHIIRTKQVYVRSGRITNFYIVHVTEAIAYIHVANKEMLCYVHTQSPLGAPQIAICSIAFLSPA